MSRSVALYYDPLFLEHDTLNHPESAARVSACIDLIESSGLGARLPRPRARDATQDELALVHSTSHIERIRRAGEQGPVMVLPDTIANRGTFAAAVRAAGACLAAVEAITRRDFDAAFCLTRPPGHHAVAAAPMGFCFFNSVAIAAAFARTSLGLERVAIVDIDIHHGNGTQDAFYADPRVLYVSTHQYPYYPGTGHWRETGEGEGRAATLNLPLPGGCGDPEYARLLDEVIAPKLRAFRPELLLVSAGYDAHFADPIDGALMRLSCAGYASLVAGLRGLAEKLCHGRIVVALEGGYDLTALSWSMRNSIEALLDDPITPDPVGLPAPATPPDIEPLIAAIKDAHGLA